MCSAFTSFGVSGFSPAGTNRNSTQSSTIRPQQRPSTSLGARKTTKKIERTHPAIYLDPTKQRPLTAGSRMANVVLAETTKPRGKGVVITRGGSASQRIANVPAKRDFRRKSTGAAVAVRGSSKFSERRSSLVERSKRQASRDGALLQ